MAGVEISDYIQEIPRAEVEIRLFPNDQEQDATWFPVLVNSGPTAVTLTFPPGSGILARVPASLPPPSSFVKVFWEPTDPTKLRG